MKKNINNRRKSAMVRLLISLKEQKKTKKKSLNEKVLISDNDRDRMKKEVSILKDRIR